MFVLIPLYRIIIFSGLLFTSHRHVIEMMFWLNRLLFDLLMLVINFHMLGLLQHKGVIHIVVVIVNVIVLDAAVIGSY